MTRPLTGEPPSRRNRRIGTVDIETNGLGGDFILGAWCVEGDENVYYFDRVESFIGVLFNRLYRDVDWFAHNGGEYDYKYFLAPLMAIARAGATVETLSQGDRTIGFTIRKGHKSYYLRDSYPLTMVSLDAFIKAYAPEHRKLDIGLKRGVIFDPTNQEHRDYLHGDVVGLRAALIAFYETIEQTFDTARGLTTSSVALHAWRTTIPNGQTWHRLSHEADSFVRNAYFGGLVYLRDIHKHRNCVTVDVNAMYASAMLRFGVPVGKYWHVTREEAGRPGFYRIRYRCPDNVEIPVLGVRTKKGLVWSRGTALTWADSDTIALARKHGYRVDVYNGFVWERTEKVFDDFLSKCQRLESEHKGKPQATLAKWMRNSLYGKFGQRQTAKRVVMTDETLPLVPVFDKNNEPIDGLYVSEEEVDNAHMLPHWAAWITAHARIILHEIADEIGAENVLYMDTDSLTFSTVYLPRVAHRIGKRYGELKVDKTWQWFRAHAPKNYIGRDEHGKLIGRAKGVSRTVYNPHDHLRSAHERVSVPFTAMSSTQAVLTHQAPFSRDTHRTYSDVTRSFAWEIEGERVRPVVFNE